MDVRSTLDGQRFVWDSDKALSNSARHGVSFEEAREVFFDQLSRYADASTPEEQREAVIGMSFREDLLYVVHVEWEDATIRLISARNAEKAERRYFEYN